MARSFFKGTFALLASGAANMAARVGPDPAAWGISAAQFASFSAANDAYQALYVASIEPATRTRGAIAARNDAALLLRRRSSDLAKIVRAQPSVTEQQLIDLQLALGGRGAPSGVPTVVPTLQVEKVTQNTVEVRIRRSEAGRRGKPESVLGAAIYSFVGDVPPADIRQWMYEGSTVRTKVAIEFPQAAAPFAKVWLTAMWINARLQAGPACPPVATNLGAWLVQDAPAAPTGDASGNLRAA